MEERRLIDDRGEFPDDQKIEAARDFVLEKIQNSHINLPSDHLDSLIFNLASKPTKYWETVFQTHWIVVSARNREVQQRQKEIQSKYATLANGLALFSVIISLVAVILQAYNFLLSPQELVLLAFQASPYLVTPLGILLAAILFACRGYLPKFYGTLEIIVGMLTVNATVDALTIDKIPTLLPFMGGIYVIIRGLDNVAKALNPEGVLGGVFSSLFNNPGKR